MNAGLLSRIRISDAEYYARGKKRNTSPKRNRTDAERVCRIVIEDTIKTDASRNSHWCSFDSGDCGRGVSSLCLAGEGARNGPVRKRRRDSPERASGRARRIAAARSAEQSFAGRRGGPLGREEACILAGGGHDGSGKRRNKRSATGAKGNPRRGCSARARRGGLGAPSGKVRTQTDRKAGERRRSELQRGSDGPGRNSL